MISLRLSILVCLAAIAGCPMEHTDPDVPIGPPDVPGAETDVPRDTPSPVDTPGDTPAFDSGTDTGADAGPPRDPCDMPGAMAVRACGFCGEASFRCEAGFWERVTPCINERECPAGGFETRTNDLCGEETRLCSAMCMWGAWSRTRPDGECRAGDRRMGDGTCPPMEVEFETCDATCTWDTSGVCEDADGCAGTPRTSPEWAREVCIPAGPYLRGVSGDHVEIMISSFFIDRYPVTYRRYAACRDAGACPLFAENNDRLTDPAWLDHPVAGAEPPHADAFCAWDGRRLPTEAEWEKAARGPVPRTDEFPGDIMPLAGPWCPTLGCAVGCREFVSNEYVTYDELCGTESFFGTRLQMFGVSEWVADYWQADWYTDPRSLVPDPIQTRPGPFDPPLRFYRGGGARGAFALISDRNPAGARPGIRCARTDS